MQSVSLRQDGSINRPQTTAVLDATPTIGPTHPDENGLIFSLFDSLPGWGVTLLTLGLVAAIILASTYLIQPIFRLIHVTGLREMYTALALLIVEGITFLMTLIGFSPALGTFLAGVDLANSELRH